MSTALVEAENPSDVRAAFVKATGVEDETVGALVARGLIAKADPKAGEPERPLPPRSNAPRLPSATSGPPGSGDRPGAWYPAWREP